MQGAAYYITFKLKDGHLTGEEVRIVLEHIKSGQSRFYLLVAVQVMSNHVHVILTPKDGFSLSRILKGVKGVSAKLVNEYRGQSGSLWEQESYDRIIRNQIDFDEKLNYMYENPLKAGIAERPEDYQGWFLQV